MIIPATVINHTSAQVSVALDDFKQPSYAAFLQSLGNYIYKIEKLYLYSNNFKQLTGTVSYNRYDATGREDIANITPTADPYQSTNGLYVELEKYQTAFILNGNSSLSTTILPNTQILVRFYCKRINNSYGLHNLNFDELENIFKQDFYKPGDGYELTKADFLLEDLPPHIQERILEKRGIRKENIKKLIYNGISEEDNKKPTLFLSFASVMIAFYLFAKNE